MCIALVHWCSVHGALHCSELQSTTILASIVESIMMNCMTSPEQLSTALRLALEATSRGDSSRTTAGSLAEQYESSEYREGHQAQRV